MHSTINEITRDLAREIAGLSKFETSVFLNCNGVIQQARVLFEHDILRLQMKQAAAVSNTEESVPDMETAFAKAASACGDGKLLIDTITVKSATAPHAVASFLPPEDKLHSLARSAWLGALGKNCVSADRLKSSQDLMQMFDQNLSNIDKLETNIWIKANGQLQEAEMTWNENSNFFHVYVRDSPFVYTGFHYDAPNAASASAAMAHLIDGAEMLMDTLSVKTQRLTKAGSSEPKVFRTLPPGDSSYDMTRKLWCAISGVSDSSEVSSLDPNTARIQYLEKILRSYLPSGKKGAAIWNKASDAEKQKVSVFDDTNFENTDLTGFKLGDLKFRSCKFNNAKMKKAQFKSTDVSHSSFSGADLTDCKFSGVTADNADFSNANFSNSKLQKSSFRNAKFTNANVSGADFKDADLRGADLTTCNMTEAAGFKNARYDETTKLPPDFAQSDELQWWGDGPDPYKLALIKAVDSSAEVSFSDFLTVIQDDFDSGRVSKALSMLKAESFKLFSEQNENGLLGVVRSQTDADLVYACRLKSDGTFSCCTQNLNTCGGLRGALCKHILVLVIGLANAGELSPKEAAQRVIASKKESPKLDKDSMTGIFLKYKGAQSGEVDWRPTETIPEDYYAF